MTFAPRQDYRARLRIGGFWYGAVFGSIWKGLFHLQPAGPGGAAAAWGYFHWRLRRRGENPGRTEQAFLWGVLGALVGAKLLYLLPQLPQLAADLPLLGQDPALFSARYLTGGFVFYGGLLGALGAVGLFCRRRKLPFGPLGADLVPAVPLFHAFGRVGCFLAGCCYGIPAPAGWWGVTFSQALLAPNGVALVPVQLYEAAGCLLLFLLLDRLARRGWSGGQLLPVYLSLYGAFRFLLEFLRGRGPGVLGPPVHLPVGGVGHPRRWPLPVLLWQQQSKRNHQRQP